MHRAEPDLLMMELTAKTVTRIHGHGFMIPLWDYLQGCTVESKLHNAMKLALLDLKYLGWYASFWI